MVEHLPFKQRVVGSIPTTLTNQEKSGGNAGKRCSGCDLLHFPLGLSKAEVAKLADAPS